jgi:hypothetical protein
MEMTKERKILTGIITAVGIVVSFAGWAAVESTLTWHDVNYVKAQDGPFLTIAEWRLASAESDERALKSQIDSLQWDVDNGQATEKDKWLLEQKKNDLEDLRGDILKLKTGRPIA